MLQRLGIVSLLVHLLAPSAWGAERDNRLYEMRVYYASPGKLDALHARFRDHTLKLFEKHGMTNVGYWVPVENPENKLIYVLSHADRQARDKAWLAFIADPDWQKAYKESEKNGTLVAKIESYFLKPTAYSPPLKITAAGDRVFELRHYLASPGKLEPLNERFRDHTLKLFEKHGMTNVVYWTLAEGQKEADQTLIYLLAHPSVDAAKAAFDKFRQDPDWQAARKASEDKAGGSLTAPNGVKSTFLRPTDYSPMK